MKKYLLLLLAIALAVIQKATAQTPVAYYPFSGNADDVIGAINGTVDGATLTTDRFGNANSAYSFDGVDDFIDIGSINFAGNDYSISFWVQLNSVTSDNAIFSGANPLFLTNTFVLSEINSGMGRFLHRNPAGTTGGVDLAGQQSIPLSHWTFISCVKQGTTLLYYVNGVLDNSVTNAAATNISSAIYVELGRLRNGSSTFIRYLNGKLDEVKIYNTALTASQVQNEYAINNQAQKPGSGNSISFDGLDDFINSGNSPAFALTNNLTLEVWVRPSAFAIVNQIFHKMGTGVNVDRTGYQLRYNNGNNIGFTIADASTIDGVSTTVTNDDLNKWMHIAATFDGTTLSLYKNGVLMNSKTTTQAITHIASEFLIGKRTDGFNFNGSLDEVRLWNTALNESQIRDRMCRKITSSDALYSNLVAYYNFDESTGTTAFDGTADANNGTLTNTPTRITSGAHIGNVSAHSYAGATSSINLAHPTIGDDLTVTLTTGGGDGVQVYCVTEAPNTTAGQVILPGNNGYFGVFPINGFGLQYTAEYNYDGITGIVNENGLKLYKRNDNAATSWINSNAALNTTNNTLIATGQNTEYMVGEDVAPNVVVSGALTGGFATVKEAFDAINAGGGSGAVTVTIIENTIETAIAQLNQTGYTVSVLPQGTRVVTGSLPNDLILLDGADDVTINGQGLSGTNTLTIRNTSASVTSSTIRLINGANNNIIRKCIVECDANSSNVTSGAIVINASSASNLAGNTIDSNLIRPVSAAGLRQGIVLAQQNTTVTGTINNTQITNNLLENVFVDNGTTGAFNILIQANCNNTVIRGNSVYATSPLNNATNGNTWYGIAMFNTGNATGSGAVIDSNYFGGTAPAATGGNFTISSPLNSIGVRSIFVQDNVANPTIITKNVIRNFSIDAGNPTTATANPFVGVQISTGNLARLDSNTIGNISNGSVNVTMRPGSTGQTGCFGILTSVACANPIANNFFGGLATIVTPTGGSTALTFLNLLDTRATTANVNIKKNIFGSTTANNITTTNSSATAFSYTGISISQTGTSLTINADSNTFRNTAMTASTINLIRNTYASSSTNTALFTMNANGMTDISTTGASASITGLNYTNNSTATNNIQTIQLHDNVLSNISVGSGTAGNLRGFLVNNAANSIGIGLKGRITGNQLSAFNNLATGTGQTGGIFVVHEMVATDSLVIANNNVNNLVHAGSGVITTVRGNVTGISVDAPLSSSMFNAPGLAVIRDNQVNNIQATTTAANAVRSQGISVYGNKTVVERNKVYNLSNTATLSTATIVPLFLNTGADDLNNILMVRNNMFAINNNTTASQTGIAMGAGTVRASIYHNSILVEGSSTTNSYAILKPGGSQVDIANNILYNATTGSGAAYVIGLGTNANGYLGNNNYFVSPAGAALAEIGTTPHTLASWQTATGDDGATQTAVSGITTNAADLFIAKATANLFINTSHPTEPAKASNLGMPLSASVPSDFAGIIRSISTPDIGAQEFIFSGTLPLNLISFSGSKQNNDALLQWRTTNEVNVSHFELQRSEDGITFTTIANVPAGTSSYRYADAGVFNTKQLVLYRLKSVDIDSRFTLSSVVRLQKIVTGSMVVYPNPATDVITISGLQQGGVIMLFSADGKLLSHQTITTQTTTVDLRSYSKGMYILSYKHEGGVINQRIIKQ